MSAKARHLRPARPKALSRLTNSQGYGRRRSARARREKWRRHLRQLTHLRWLDVHRQGSAEVTEALLLEFVAAQHATNAKPRSINRRVTTARLFFRFATGEELPRGKGVSAPHAVLPRPAPGPHPRPAQRRGAPTTLAPRESTAAARRAAAARDRARVPRQAPSPPGPGDRVPAPVRKAPAVSTSLPDIANEFLA